MTDKILVLPILIPFFTAICCLLAWHSVKTQRILSLAGTSALAVAALYLFFYVRASGICATQMGSWPAPFGITLACDLLSAVMVVMAGTIGLCVVVYSMAGIDGPREAFGYYPLVNILLMGVCGAFLTGDIFNMYVWFEVMLMASFVLLELGGEKAQLEGAVKYVTLNLISSALFLTGVAVLYGITGSLNMAELAVILGKADSTGLVNAVAMLFFLAFGIKAAAFPLFFWLPASYHTPPAPVSAVFAGLLTKVGVYAMLRVFTLIFVRNMTGLHMIILISAALTMLSGVFGAIAQKDFRRILSFQIVSHVGYMLMGLGLFTVQAVTGAIFYTFHHMIAITNLFFISGIVNRFAGTYRIKDLGGLYRQFPGFSVLFLVAAFALSGIPPLSGFWAKFVLIQSGFFIGNYWIGAVALLVSLLTLYSMGLIWNEVFWKPAPDAGSVGSATLVSPLSMLMPVIVLTGLSIFIGLFADTFYSLAHQAAGQLMDPTDYINTVLGRGKI